MNWELEQIATRTLEAVGARLPVDPDLVAFLSADIGKRIFCARQPES